MDRVRRHHHLSQRALYSRVVSYRDAAVTLPVVLVAMQSAEGAVVAADPLRRIHKKNRSVKLYWISQNTSTRRLKSLSKADDKVSILKSLVILYSHDASNWHPQRL